MRRGLDGERRLINARHEIRGLACLPLTDARYFVAAGDKSGFWYATEFDFDDPEGTVSPFVTLDPPRTPKGSKKRVIDDILIVPWGVGGYGIVLATRGNGAWIAPLDEVRDRLLRREDGKVGLMRLPESTGRKMHGLVYDASSRTLFAIAHHQSMHELFAWSLAKQDLQATRENFGSHGLTCIAIDKADGRDEEDLLYVATNRFELFTFERPRANAPFRVTAQTLAIKAAREESVWQGRLSPILRMRPLSDVGYRDPQGQWRRTFPQRGVVAMTLRHLLLVYDMPDEPARYHSRLVAGETMNLDLKILNFPEREEDQQALSGWHAVAVSTLENKLRIFRPSGLRLPESGGFGLFRRDTPETRFPTHLLSGYKDVPEDVLRDRAYALEAIPPPGDSGPEMGLILGLGDQEVRWHRYKLRWRLREEARELARQLVQDAPAIELVLDTLEEIALSSVYWREDSQELVHDSDELDPRHDKHTLLEIIPRLWRRCRSDDHWHRFFLLVWDVLTRRTPRYVAVGMIQAIRRVQLKLSEELKGQELHRRRSEIEDQITKIRKFVLDPGHFSQKRTHFLELASSEDPDLEDERDIYRSILISRRHDPVFVNDFDPMETGLIGEVLTFTPLPSSHDSGPFWEAENPEDIRFVATNYNGELWLLDGVGRAARLTGSRAERTNAIHAAHVFGDALLLSFADGQLRQLCWRRLPKTVDKTVSTEPQFEDFDPIGQRSVAVTAFADVPAGAGKCRLLWGDARGGIYLLGQDEPLFAPPSYRHPEQRATPAGMNTRSQAIRQLQWLEAAWPGGKRTCHVLATTENGEILLFHWSENGKVRLTCACRLQLSNDPISALTVTGPQNRHVVVGRFDTAIGLEIVGSPDTPRFGLVWAFRTEDTVRSIQPVPPDLATDRRPHRVLVGSHDAHLYALDLQGRHLETLSLRQDPLRPGSEGREREGFKAGVFVTAPPRPDDSDHVILRVYACAFENRYLGLRLIDRPRMLEDFAKALDRLESRERELRLTRWRAYHVEEDHLRHRFVLQSRRYPGSRPEEIFSVLDWLLEAGDTSMEPTGEMTALLRRLFRGQPGADARGRSGLDTLLEEPSLYRQTIDLLRNCDQRWGTPNSIANQRLKLFWIRSFLREIRTPETLRRWVEVADEVAVQGEPLAQPQALMRHFLEHSGRLVQYKTLQYLERLIFGWPESRQSRPLFRRGKVRPSDLDWLIDSLFSRLVLRPEQVSRQDPSPAVLQIGRLLSLLIRDGHVDPLFVTYQIQRHSIGFDMYRILEDQLETLVPGDGDTPETPSNLDPAIILRDARRLDESLAHRAPLAIVVENLEAISNRTWPETRGPDAVYLSQAPIFFRTLLPLLRLEKLEHFRDLAVSWEPPSADLRFAYYPSYSYLAELRPVLQAAQDYFYKKYNDQYVAPVLMHLSFADFHRVRCEWRLWKARAEGLLNDDPPALAQREALLLERLLQNCEKVLIEREQATALLQDFQSALEAHCFEDIEQSYRFDPEKVKQVQEEKALAFTAFSNLFTRLLLLAEPIEGAFLYRWKDEGETEEIRGRWFRGGHDDFPEVTELTVKRCPDWLPANWSEPEDFPDLVQAFDSLAKSDSKRVWRIETISGTPDEKGTVAYYVFGWTDAAASGLERFTKQRLAWAVPLQALVYRRAAVEQVELKGRVFSIIAHNLGSPVFHLRSDLRVLLDRRLEDAAKQRKRLDKYGQLLRQARHMEGIIDSILSLSDRKISVALTVFSVPQLVYDAVRTIRREAKGRNVQIEFPEPDAETLRQVTIHSDEAKVYDVLMMLLSNAVKYSPIGGRIFVAVGAKSKGVEIRVTDQGPGIPEDERPHIYEAFFRGSIARKETASGLGLGLYTAKLYTELLHGHINHRNHPNGGSVFDLFVPDLEETDH